MIKATVKHTDVSNPGLAARALNNALRIKLQAEVKRRDITRKEYRRARKVIG